VSFIHYKSVLVLASR